MKKTLIGSGLALALVLGGCAQPPSASPSAGGSNTPAPGATPSDFLACMVSDNGGFDDKSFNETSHKGLTDAKTQLLIKTKEVQSTTNADYAPNVQNMIDAKCDVIVTVGFKIADVTLAAAKKNPDTKFAIVDAAYTDPKTGKNTAPANLKGLLFNSAEPSYLAGYAAASLSQSGKVGTFGGAKIPSVTSFMSGYAQGVEKYNQDKGKNVQVVGWNTKSKDGTFIPSGNFDDVAGGKNVSTQLVNQGVDVIMPVAGPAGEGALQVAQGSGGKVAAVWVDTDGYVSQPKYKAAIATSVGKAMDVAVFDAIKAAKDDQFTNEPYTGTIANKGVYLAPFHDYDAKVSAETKSELDKLQADIASGAIKVEA
ncbi:BMP family ABC transporter substrate-binding protein [Nigerium massiliense]|uniref:BMP family ABC transporter substrate-binding protein n=1 Tax=Nigerium massiliense TaxID=1522317 RepID=UPI00058C17F1|nr:BMP family ABC transporter substrate-binding protein [Nigerium massiliense]